LFAPDNGEISCREVDYPGDKNECTQNFTDKVLFTRPVDTKFREFDPPLLRLISPLDKKLRLFANCRKRASTEQRFGISAVDERPECT